MWPRPHARASLASPQFKVQEQTELESIQVSDRSDIALFYLTYILGFFFREFLQFKLWGFIVAELLTRSYALHYADVNALKARNFVCDITDIDCVKAVHVKLN